jgi:Family of unknown function (DUF6807)
MTRSACVAGLLLLAVGPGVGANEAPLVEVSEVASAKRVDVSVGGHPFTAYIWPDRLAKPVLYPILTAHGTPVTRGFPLDPRPGERVDHPHQVGLWLSYGDVNGVDFWNNSEARPPAERAKMGRTEQRKVVSHASGSGQGELVVEADWKMPDGSVALVEHTRFVFRADATTRSIERAKEFEAVAPQVHFNDNKEGFFGMRVVRALEEPSDKPEVFTDASGKPTAVPVLDNAGVNGNYISSEGLEGGKVWGTRARWVALTGKVAGEDVVLLMLDHPKNPGYPAYWHARGYGLFAANPLGQAIFSEGQQRLDFTLEKGQRASFRYRLLVLPGPFSREQAEQAAAEFAR